MSPKFFVESLKTYLNSPSLVLWRAIEARALAPISFTPPVLDLACGTGHFARILLGNIAITGCDLDKNAIGVAAKEKTLNTVSVADARALPYPDKSFNSVLSNCALEHISDVEQAIAEVARVLRPMGLFVFTVPSEYFNDSLLLPQLYKILGLNSRARRHIHWYNSLQQHHHIDSFAVWEKRLNTAGLELILHRYYMPRVASFVFSLLDVTAKCTLEPQSERHIHVQQFILNRIPNRLLLWIFYYHLLRCYGSLSYADGGSGLLVVARKETERC